MPGEMSSRFHNEQRRAIIMKCIYIHGHALLHCPSHPSVIHRARIATSDAGAKAESKPRVTFIGLEPYAIIVYNFWGKINRGASRLIKLFKAGPFCIEPTGGQV